jgi:hypothetical protein
MGYSFNEDIPPFDDLNERRLQLQLREAGSLQSLNMMNRFAMWTTNAAYREKLQDEQIPPKLEMDNLQTTDFFEPPFNAELRSREDEKRNREESRKRKRQEKHNRKKWRYGE